MIKLLFNTLVEAEAYAAQSATDWLAAHIDEPYHTETTAWGIPLDMGDGTYTMKPCPYTDNTGIPTVE